MNKNGFTLVELLAIVVILALIMVVAAPNMTKQIQKNEDENKNILNQKIENASKLYAAKYYANKLVSGEEITFTLNDLEKDGLINLKGKCSTVKEKKITVQNGNYNYINITNNDTIDDCYSS